MSRAARQSLISGANYRDFAILVVVAAAVIALFADDGGPAPANHPAPASHPAPVKLEKAAPPLIQKVTTASTGHDADDQLSSEPDNAPDAGNESPRQPAAAPTEGGATDPVMMHQHTAPGMPRAGTFAPDARPGQQQIARIIEASRLRSGSGEGGD